MTGKGFVGDGGAVVQEKARSDLPGRIRGNDVRRDAQILLHSDVGPKLSGVPVAGEDQVAGLQITAFAADDLTEIAENFQALPGHSGVNRRGVVHPKGGRGTAGGAGTQNVSLQEHRVLESPGGQVVQNAATHYPAADDYRVCRCCRCGHSRWLPVTGGC